MIRKGLVWGTLLYTLGLLGLALLWRLNIDVWWVALPNIVAPFLFLPLILLMPLAFWVRPGTYSRPYLLCVGVLVLVFGFSFGDRFLPRSPVAGVANGTELRIMTFNHLYLNRDLEAIKQTILRQDADLVALQELTPEVAAMVRREFGTRYPYQQLRPSDRSTSTKGIGLLSRFPLTKVGYNDDYGGQHATVQIGERELKLINLHLMIPFGGRESDRPPAFDPDIRARQLEKLKLTVKAAPELEGLIVVGDFNLSDREPGYRELTDLMTDAYRSTRRGFGFTFPTGRAYAGVPLPLLARLDYV